jgi:hypothetical protein
MFAELHWRNKIYVILQVVIRYGKWSSVPTALVVTAHSRNVEGLIMVASSIEEHKIGPFKTTADVTFKFLVDHCG